MALDLSLCSLCMGFVLSCCPVKQTHILLSALSFVAWWHGDIVTNAYASQAAELFVEELAEKAREGLGCNMAE